MANWFKKEKQVLPVMASCPKKCGVHQANAVRTVEPEEVGISPSIARAAKLESGAKLLYCQSCGCVWRRVFDSDSAKLQNEVLGTFARDQAAGLNLESWLQQAAEPAIGPA